MLARAVAMAQRSAIRALLKDIAGHPCGRVLLAAMPSAGEPGKGQGSGLEPVVEGRLSPTVCLEGTTKNCRFPTRKNLLA